MGLRWHAVTAISLIYAYFATSRTSVLGFLASFLVAWVVQFSLFAVWAVILYPTFFSPLSGLPEPSGNGWVMGQWRRIVDERPGGPMLDWTNSIPNNGLIRFRSLFNQERIMPVSPQALKEVLVTKNYDFTKPSEFVTGLGRLLGIGLFLAEGEEHKHQRRNLLPAFAFRHLKDLVPIFWDMSREGVLVMADKVLAEAQQNSDEEKLPPKTAVLEISDWASRMTLDIIGVTGLGRDFGATKDPDNDLAKTYNVLFSPSPQAQLLGMLQLFLPGWVVNMLPIKRNSTVGHASAEIRGLCADLIASKKRRLAAKTLDDHDILSVALESGGFTDENLVDQLMTFLAAGHETTATAMTWTIYMLCLHPEMQDRLREEVRSRLPSLDADATAAPVSALDFDHMPYLNAVCNESLRYHPPAPMSLRVSAVDTTICDQHVPKGTRVMIVPLAINRSRELWGPDAGEFKPDRWLPYFEGDKGAASGHAASNYAFLTFFHGPRSCIGQGFAKAEFACLLAAWVGRFRFELRDEKDRDEGKMKIKGIITARPADGLWVKATVLDGW
ncbi:cytochrome P450 97B3 [Coniochaeta ligniaria NRRL 30616]|uniref:Cytochrome P450 97B3 n=1 Tax=Coniochaeta ligniaria NRRL 30616 TaxID=1408157 RepID=A0A1J7J646_9PEZI|nr:cytochrome P450 97B3 [Coniochaeta ligniaria NRRL 30616]